MRLKNLLLGILCTTTCLLISTPASAQLSGLLGGKKADTVDVGKALNAGSDLIAYITLATALGNDAADSLADMFPPEKMEAIKKLSLQGAELKAKSKDANIDAEQMKVFEDKSALLAKMQAEGQLKDYKKEKLANVSKAHGKLGLMVLADGFAGTKIKPVVDGLQAALNQITKDPLQAGKLETIKYQIGVLTVVGTALPKQVSSANTVRSICSQISAAENITLPADLSPDKVKDTAALNASSKDLSS